MPGRASHLQRYSVRSIMCVSGSDGPNFAPEHENGAFPSTECSMKLFIRRGVATLVTGVILSSHALAQGPAPTGFRSPSARPAVSPYLDLARGGDPTFSYYRRILP